MKSARIILAATAATAVGVAAVGPLASADTPVEPKAAQAGAQKNIVRTAAGAGDFDTLTSLLKQAGLARTLRGEGPFTVFAPTDAAFDEVPDSTLQELAGDKAKLRAVLLYHVVDRRLPAAKVVKRRSVKTLNGQRLRIRVRDSGVKVGGARVTATDVAASNGVIHVIDDVLIPR
jgi:uncharacterized surface protein with fasciclin (FAS1) repeats